MLQRFRMTKKKKFSYANIVSLYPFFFFLITYSIDIFAYLDQFIFFIEYSFLSIYLIFVVVLIDLFIIDKALWIINLYN